MRDEVKDLRRRIYNTRVERFRAKTGRVISSPLYCMLLAEIELWCYRENRPVLYGPNRGLLFVGIEIFPLDPNKVPERMIVEMVDM